MYDLKFDEALQKTAEAEKAAPADPMPCVAEASAILFREFDRLHILRSETFASDDAFDARPAQKWDSIHQKQFDAALAHAEQLGKAQLDRKKNDAEALFALALVNGLRADDLALIQKRNMAALSSTKTATAYADRLLVVAPNYYDAYVATGMGKYIIGGKPAPVRWILRLDGLKGDQEEGVRELKIAAEHGHYLAPFARILLAFDDLRHKNKADARQTFASLHQEFPDNPLFPEELQKLDHASAGGGQ